MRTIDDIETLTALYGPPSRTALAKVTKTITPAYEAGSKPPASAC